MKSTLGPARHARRTIGANIVHLDVTTSTMDEAARLAAAGAPDGTVVLADRQTLGRGRHGRRWHSPPGAGLWASVVLRQPDAAAAAAQLTALAAVSVAEATRRVTGLPISIKWPNDLLVGARKVCGILTELPSPTVVITGIGLNINQQQEDFPPELRSRATSLALEAGQPFDCQAILAELLTMLDTNYRVHRQLGFAPLALRWNELSTLPGAAVIVRTRQRVLRGTVLGLGANGALQVRTAGGMIHVWDAEVEVELQPQQETADEA